MADDKAKVVVASGGGFSVLIVLMILFSFWLANNNPNATKNQPKAVSKTSSSQSSQTQSQKLDTYVDKTTGKEKTFSVYHNQISLSSGAAASTYQPNKEYIVLSAHGNKTPINLGGWTLKNGRDKQMFVVSGNTVRGQSVSVKIPSFGVALYNPYNPAVNRYSPLVLKSGERAIITTGSAPTLNNVTIKDNFKLNQCLGYLEDDTGYRAYPSVSYRCPSSDDVPGISSLDNICYDFVRSIRACHTPKDVYVKNEGYCLDRNCKLTSYCRSFIKDNYNFNTCFSRYSGDKDFVSSEWRIFLNQTWELWGDRRETISLYDRSGLLVDEISY
ncbi:MAG: hypothetical protein NT041_00620 [Candidatus Vogelbacteria bacterium]|nr:hypothetical protein [Candidatus Vogelbacteria bacterium]